MYWSTSEEYPDKPQERRALVLDAISRKAQSVLTKKDKKLMLQIYMRFQEDNINFQDKIAMLQALEEFVPRGSVSNW